MRRQDAARRMVLLVEARMLGTVVIVDMLFFAMALLPFYMVLMDGLLGVIVVVMNDLVVRSAGRRAVDHDRRWWWRRCRNDVNRGNRRGWRSHVDRCHMGRGLQRSDQCMGEQAGAEAQGEFFKPLVRSMAGMRHGREQKDAKEDGGRE